MAFQKTAELVAQYLDKGSLVGIEGRIQSRQFQGQDGKPQTWVEIVANNVRFLESKSEADRRRAAKGQSGPPGANAVRPPAATPDTAAPPAAAPATAAPQAPPPTPTDDFGPVGESEDPFGDQ